LSSIHSSRVSCARRCPVGECRSSKATACQGPTSSVVRSGPGACRSAGWGGFRWWRIAAVNEVICSGVARSRARAAVVWNRWTHSGMWPRPPQCGHGRADLR
jgi:hypothetical protein